jgi:hypothetical protein
MGSDQGIADLKTVLNTIAIPGTPSSQEAAKTRLRQRCWEIYGEKASVAIASARKFLVQDDSQGAEEVLQETMPWLELAPPQSQEELRALQTETAAAKKILRFRRGSRR